MAEPTINGNPTTPTPANTNATGGQNTNQKTETPKSLNMRFGVSGSGGAVIGDHTGPEFEVNGEVEKPLGAKTVLRAGGGIQTGQYTKDFVTPDGAAGKSTIGIGSVGVDAFISLGYYVLPKLSFSVGLKGALRLLSTPPSAFETNGVTSENCSMIEDPAERAMCEEEAMELVAGQGGQINKGTAGLIGDQGFARDAEGGMLVSLGFPIDGRYSITDRLQVFVNYAPTIYGANPIKGDGTSFLGQKLMLGAVYYTDPRSIGGGIVPPPELKGIVTREGVYFSRLPEKGETAPTARITKKAGETLKIEGPQPGGWPKGTKAYLEGQKDPIRTSANGDPIEISDLAEGTSKIEIKDKDGKTLGIVELTVEAASGNAPQKIEVAPGAPAVVSTDDKNSPVVKDITSPVDGDLEGEFRKKDDVNAPTVPAKFDPEAVKANEQTTVTITPETPLEAGEWELVVKIANPADTAKPIQTDPIPVTAKALPSPQKDIDKSVNESKLTLTPTDPNNPKYMVLKYESKRNSGDEDELEIGQVRFRWRRKDKESSRPTSEVAGYGSGRSIIVDKYGQAKAEQIKIPDEVLDLVKPQPTTFFVEMEVTSADGLKATKRIEVTLKKPEAPVAVITLPMQVANKSRNPVPTGMFSITGAENLPVIIRVETDVVDNDVTSGSKSNSVEKPVTLTATPQAVPLNGAYPMGGDTQYSGKSSYNVTVTVKTATNGNVIGRRTFTVAGDSNSAPTTTQGVDGAAPPTSPQPPIINDDDDDKPTSAGGRTPPP